MFQRKLHSPATYHALHAWSRFFSRDVILHVGVDIADCLGIKSSSPAGPADSGIEFQLPSSLHSSMQMITDQVGENAMCHGLLSAR